MSSTSTFRPDPTESRQTSGVPCRHRLIERCSGHRLYQPRSFLKRSLELQIGPSDRRNGCEDWPHTLVDALHFIVHAAILLNAGDSYLVLAIAIYVANFRSVQSGLLIQPDFRYQSRNPSMDA